MRVGGGLPRSGGGDIWDEASGGRRRGRAQVSKSRRGPLRATVDPSLKARDIWGIQRFGSFGFVSITVALWSQQSP